MRSVFLHSHKQPGVLYRIGLVAIGPEEADEAETGTRMSVDRSDDNGSTWAPDSVWIDDLQSITEIDFAELPELAALFNEIPGPVRHAAGKLEPFTFQALRYMVNLPGFLRLAWMEPALVLALLHRRPSDQIIQECASETNTAKPLAILPILGLAESASILSALRCIDFCYCDVSDHQVLIEFIADRGLFEKFSSFNLEKFPAFLVPKLLRHPYLLECPVFGSIVKDIYARWVEYAEETETVRLRAVRVFRDAIGWLDYLIREVKKGNSPDLKQKLGQVRTSLDLLVLCEQVSRADRSGSPGQFLPPGDFPVPPSDIMNGLDPITSLDELILEGKGIPDLLTAVNLVALYRGWLCFYRFDEPGLGVVAFPTQKGMEIGFFWFPTYRLYTKEFRRVPKEVMEQLEETWGTPCEDFNVLSRPDW